VGKVRRREKTRPGSLIGPPVFCYWGAPGRLVGLANVASPWCLHQKVTEPDALGSVLARRSARNSIAPVLLLLEPPSLTTANSTRVAKKSPIIESTAKKTSKKPGGFRRGVTGQPPRLLSEKGTRPPLVD